MLGRTPPLDTHLNKIDPVTKTWMKNASRPLPGSSIRRYSFRFHGFRIALATA